MARDSSVFYMGEDVGKIGGVLGSTVGLFKEFGGERVRDTPISEEAIVGCAVGAARMGMRPIVEIDSHEWLLPALDQLVNHAAKYAYISGGKERVPLVLRSFCLEKRASGAQHSQCFDALFLHFPGLKLAVPSTPYDVKGLLKSAIRDDNPVVFLEQAANFAVKGELAEEEYLVPFGKADVKRKGKDVTLVAISSLVHQGLKIAEELAKEGLSVEVIDPRTLSPLDYEAIIESVKKTGHLVVAEKGGKTGGIGGEIAARVMEAAFDFLDAPIKRVAGDDFPLPYAPVLRDQLVPKEAKIVAAIREII
jgi:pyruvate/2-oxoglutarate/acetoin dehydrogenase E1 component